MKTGCLLAFAAMSAGLLTAQHTAGANRPAQVPSDYVVTPFGYMHSSCVQSIKEGETLLATGKIQHTDGTKTGGAPCAHQTFAADGSPKDPAPKSVKPQIDGWVESSSAVAPPNQSFSVIYSINNVPPLPPNDEGQTLFFFPGLEDINDQSTSILQPVLTYYDRSWYVANWNCCINGVTTHSTPMYTTPGHVIVSGTAQNCGPNTLSCKTWTIFSYDDQTKQNTSLSHTPSEGQIFNWAFAAVMEVYGVNTCADYPAQPEVYDTLFFDEKYQVASPHWTTNIGSGILQCGYAIKTGRDGDDFTLEYSD